MVEFPCLPNLESHLWCPFNQWSRAPSASHHRRSPCHQISRSNRRQLSNGSCPRSRAFPWNGPSPQLKSTKKQRGRRTMAEKRWSCRLIRRRSTAIRERQHRPQSRDGRLHHSAPYTWLPRRMRCLLTRRRSTSYRRTITGLPDNRNFSLANMISTRGFVHSLRRFPD